MSAVTCKTLEVRGRGVERCGCGCPNVPDLHISHRLLRDAARSKWTLDETVEKLQASPGFPAGAKRMRDMLLSAKASMVRQQLLGKDELAW